MDDRKAWGTGTPSRDSIAAVALQMVDADGVGELSMRKLAAELGAHPTALYRRVADRDEILDLVGNAVLAEVELERLQGSWVEQLLVLALEFRAAVGRHPNAAPLLNTWTRAGEAMAGISESVFSNLSQAGLQGRPLLEAYNAYLGYVVGASVTEVLSRPGGPPGGSSRRTVELDLWERHPRLAGVVAQFDDLISSTPEPELRSAVFQAGVETVLAGLQARYDLDPPVPSVGRPG